MLNIKIKVEGKESRKGEYGRMDSIERFDSIGDLKNLVK